MAEQSSSSQKSNLFLAGMNSDLDPSFIPDGAWSYARNASKVTASGSLQTLSNESSNILCTLAPYPIIGNIHLYEDKWAVFSTDNTHSEIGWFDDSDCSYVPLRNELNQDMNPTNCLNFNTKYLIKGISKQNFDCTWSVYFADSNNPDRMVNMNKPQFVCIPVTVNDCIICTDTTQIDCQAIRLASLVESPCIKVSKSRTGGTILNGSYFAVIAYTINDQVVTDYFPPSNVQTLFDHSNVAGSLDITFTGLDTDHFSEFQLVIVRTVNQQVSAKKIGIYSTQTQEIFIDNINEALPTVPIEQIPIRNPVYEKSDAIYSVGDYAIRIAPVTKFDFNYQPLANRIITKWISVEYDSDYYRKGGNITSYMRDEIYSLFIRWVYDTGDRSASYHIPGRFLIPGTDDLPVPVSDVINTGETYWEVVNTAFITPSAVTTLPDGGVQIAEGRMGYWQSTEKYPDNRPDLWNLSYWQQPNTANNWVDSTSGNLAYDLCGKFIRHHKMPDNLTGYVNPTNAPCQHINAGASKIRVIGVKFDNIRPPLDNDGVPIPGISGYEILRGSREGNKTIIAKGIINNVRGYTINGGQPNPRQGLYQNYPYNFRGPDPTLRTQESTGGYSLLGQPGSDLTDVKRNIFTFHSPDTQFKHPFLSTNELKLYGETTASIIGNFETVPYHPKEKLLGDAAFIVATLVGIGEAMLAMRGQRTHTLVMPHSNVISQFQDKYTVAKQNKISGGLTGTFSSIGVGVATVNATTVTATNNSGGDRAAYDVPELNAPSDDPNAPDGHEAQAEAALIWNNAYQQGLISGSDVQGYGTLNFIALAAALGLGGDPKDADTENFMKDFTPTHGLDSGWMERNKEDSKMDRIPGGLIKAFSFVPVFANYLITGTDTAMKLIEALVPFEQYSLRYISHGMYADIANNTGVGPGTRRYHINDEQYLEQQRQSFAAAEVNNLYRSQAVILQTAKVIPDPAGIDNSLFTVSTSPPAKPGPTFPSTSNSHYTALIQRFRNQYGQLDSIQQLNIGCKFDITSLTTDYFTSALFGGDTYISRYTEKNTFFYFYDWLIDQPDGFEFNYRTRYMLTYPRYWADFTRYEPSDYLGGWTNFLTAGIIGSSPSQQAALDGANVFGLGGFLSLLTAAKFIQFRVKPGWFYTFQSGVRDFYVESEVNTAFRDWDDVPEKRHYDPYDYASLEPLFDPKIIKVGNYFKYDYSLSISRLFINFISWGNLQPRYYDPLVAETCYVRRPNRLIYSLPQNLENTKDYWRVYLANNYKDFVSDISVIKPTAKNGAIILFKSDSPLLFQGVDTLQTDLNTKITLGDGGLFSQPQQSLVNVDVSYEYGSCQDRLSVINTPFGLYYMCTNQGKIFQATDSLKDITYDGLKFWFKEYLPLRLLKDFPDFDILDNPLAGVGCQAIYDNQIETIYFCKRDFQLKSNLKGPVTYSGNGIFSYSSPNGVIDLPLGDPLIFQDASFTVSYDPKSEKGGWISYHDWHPDLNIPSKNNFLTTKAEGIWRHNKSTQSFCKYYDIQYPFSIEFIAPTPNVNTLRSIEYYLECYKYNQNTLDRYNLLDYNFDRAIIHNIDQVSGVLNLNITPKNDPWGELLYPKLNLVPEWEILYSKEESKIRFQDFFDITRDRGEFPPYAKQVIWNTEPNGYIRRLNPNNLNYSKEQLQLKKFRGYLGKVYLEKKNPEDILMSIKAVQTKLLESIR